MPVDHLQLPRAIAKAELMIIDLRARDRESHLLTTERRWTILRGRRWFVGCERCGMRFGPYKDEAQARSLMRLLRVVSARCGR